MNLQYALQVGACLVSSDGEVIGTGYNGMPDGCSDDDLSWSKPPKKKPCLDLATQQDLGKTKFGE